MAILQRSFFGVKPGRKMKIAPKGKKYCADCDKAKPLGQFHRNALAPDGLSYYCKDCSATKDRANSGKSKASSWMRRYGLSEHAYWDLFEAQGGVCAICHQPETCVIRGTTALLSVDHDHRTGAVRGLLCQHCNHGLGRFFDKPELLEEAIAYLRRQL